MNTVRLSTRRRRVATRSSLTAALTAVLLAGSITAATATPQGYEEQDHNAGRFYGNF